MYPTTLQPPAMEDLTLTVSRESGPDITARLVWLDDWNILEALDDWGHPVALTPEEVKNLVARAEAGEDETGR